MTYLKHLLEKKNRNNQKVERLDEILSKKERLSSFKKMECNNTRGMT